MKDEKEQLDTKKIAKQREYTQKAEEMLKAGASFLADTGFIQLSQIKFKSNLSSDLVQITYNTPAGIMPIKFKINGTKIYQESPILLNVSKMAYVLYRMIVENIGSNYLYSPVVLRDCAEEEERKAYYEEVWYLLMFIEKALEFDDFTAKELNIVPMNKEKAVKTINILEQKLDLSADEKKMVDKVKALSPISLTVLYKAFSYPTIQTRVDVNKILNYFATADKKINFNFIFNSLNPVPVGLIQDLIVSINRNVHPSPGEGNKTENKQSQTTRKPARKEKIS